MIKINLLPYREKEKKESLLFELILLSGTLGLFVLILLVVHVWFTISVSSLETKIQEADTKLIELDKKVGDIDRFKKDKRELEQKLGVINSLETGRIFPIHLLDGLNMLVLPKEIWLEKVTQTGDSLRIEGIAKDNGTVARFMKNLEKAKFVQSVELVVAKEREIVGVKLQQFTLTCGLNKGT
jgi:type IV pilus assembly protein PilN